MTSGYCLLLAGGWETGVLFNLTTFWIGGDWYNSTKTGLSGAGNYPNGQVRVPRAGTITVVTLKIRVATVGTAESVDHYIRINDTTDIAHIGAAYNALHLNVFRATLQPVNAGDFIALKIVTPAFATRPIGARWVCSVLIA